MEALQQLDEELFLYLNNMGSTSWDWFWVSLTNEWMSIPIYALLSWLIYRKVGFKPAIVHGITLVGIVVASYVISHLLKDGIMRPRPCDVGLNMRYLTGEDCLGKFGFPSTHSSVGLGIMLYIGLVLKRYYKYILPILMVWVLFFSYSRIYVGRHYPGDVLVGLIIGLVVAIVAYYVRNWIKEKYKV